MYEMLTEGIYPILNRQPEHYARLKGNADHPDIEGMVLFYRFRRGTVVVADITGLPTDGMNIFGFHIHEGFSCTGNAEDVFADTKGHFNPYGVKHPGHAGDMPVLFGNGGKAWMAFFTERFLPGEVTGRTVVIHDMPDDFASQPAGGAGEKIACGVII